ncbi:hypothetical protein CDAR_414041 [Caerostris darwini]|uniref:Calponin-homology (CH) domain-containing protein n=1 Tax=Caerostris darwini TaxID=1538125 RepID=A0AAV4RE48_9ARAC|nr:hypothetical protein CDAR_414041 [Caerostris darwini]
MITSGDRCRRVDHIRKARLRAYVGWLNSQLRKEEGGVRRVSDLRNDLRDGVILAHLVASLGNDIVPGIIANPRTEAQAKENVDRLFRFLIRKGVPIHSLTPKDYSRRPEVLQLSK